MPPDTSPSGCLRQPDRHALKIAERVQHDGLVQDNNELTVRGIEPATAEAVPFYSAWTRTDVALTAALVGLIANDIRQILNYAKVCALTLIVIAALIAFRLW